MINCPGCGSIFLRIHGRWERKSDKITTRTVACGDCGGVFELQATHVRSWLTDAQAKEAGNTGMVVVKPGESSPA